MNSKTCFVLCRSEIPLIDFDSLSILENWSEETRPVNTSKSLIYVYNNPNSESAMFYSYLDPKPNNSICYSGIHRMVQLNLEGYRYITFTCIAKGNATVYKIILKDSSLVVPKPSFEQNFKVGTLFYKS